MVFVAKVDSYRTRQPWSICCSPIFISTRRTAAVSSNSFPEVYPLEGLQQWEKIDLRFGCQPWCQHFLSEFFFGVTTDPGAIRKNDALEAIINHPTPRVMTAIVASPEGSCCCRSRLQARHVA